MSVRTSGAARALLALPLGAWTGYELVVTGRLMLEAFGIGVAMAWSACMAVGVGLLLASALCPTMR